MTDDFKIEYPTWGDLASEQVRRHGLPYFGDVRAQIAARLEQLLPSARQAFALSCAERLMRRHQSQPPQEQRPFTLGWRPALDAIREGLIAETGESTRLVSEALDAFHKSPYDHADGPDGPDDADEHAASASIYACECYLSGDPQLAFWASSRAIDAAFSIADDELQLDPNDFVWDPGAEPMPLARQAMHPAVQAELATQLSDLSILEGTVLDRNLIERLLGAS